MDEDSGFFTPGEAERSGGTPSDVEGELNAANAPNASPLSPDAETGAGAAEGPQPSVDAPTPCAAPLADALACDDDAASAGQSAPDLSAFEAGEGAWDGEAPEASGLCPKGISDDVFAPPPADDAFADSMADGAFAEPAADDAFAPSVPDSPLTASAPGATVLSGLDALETAERNAPGARLLGIRLRKAGQVYFIADAGHTVRIGTKVVVGLEQGPSLGEVVSILQNGRITGDAEEGVCAPGEVLGLATAQDIAQHAENSILAAEASAFCKTCIRQRSLDMKLVDVEVLHDRSKIIFFFTAPSRIDFRELVKDLVRNYRTRIELRQIGVRHETQMIGGLGNCGMVCCCHRYLRKFAPVTIKMAKEQNLFLNPAKLSGMCGRLLCCLSFEQGNYEEFNRRCPKLGKKYVTSRGVMKVLRANMFSRSIVALSEAGEEIEMPLEEWDGLDPKRAEGPAPDQQRPHPPRAEGGRRNGPRKIEEQRHDDGPFEESGQSGAENGAAEQRRHHRPRKRRREQP